MNNVDYVVICANQGVNKCNLLVHPDPGLNLPVCLPCDKINDNTKISIPEINLSRTFNTLIMNTFPNNDAPLLEP